MRKLLTLLLATFYFFSVKAEDIRDGSHIFNYNITLSTCKLDGTVIGAGVPGTQTIVANRRFIVRSIIGTDYIIQIITFSGSSATAAALNAQFVRVPAVAAVAGGVGIAPVAAVPAIEIFFKLPITDYPNYAERFQKRGNLTIGASTTLIKLRPGRKEPKDGYDIFSEFGNDFNIGASIGWKFQPYRRKQLYHNIVFGLSFSDIKATPYTTKDFITSEANQACITFSLGYLFEYNKFQISLFTGLDVMSGEIGRNWIYKGRPWIGIGFGFQIFRAQGETNN